MSEGASGGAIRGPLAAARGALARTRDRVRADLRTDPYLPYVLAGAVLLAGFWFWFRAPNFGSPDEYSRLIDPMKAAGRFVADPGLGSLRRGILDGRAIGATFYLYGLVLVPAFLVVVLTGRLGEFAALGGLESRWALWHAAPSWFWTLSIVLGRLVVVALAACCVYVTYRLGAEVHDRRAGRIGAAALAASLGFVSTAHEVSEDVPMLLVLLVATVLAVRYLRAGRDTAFLGSALLGGVAIAFKPTAGAVVFVVGAAFLLRARREGWPGALVRPRLLVAGLVAGGVAVYVGMPAVLFGGPDVLVERLTASVGQKTGAQQPYPSWYYLLAGYLNALGLPLFLATLAGVGASAVAAGRGRTRADALALLWVPLAVYAFVFSGWQWVRVHHLLPTLPLAFVLTGVAAATLAERARWSRLVRVLAAAVLVVTAAYTAVGVTGYADDPRDRATEWLADRDLRDGELEVYENSVADVGVPHGTHTSRYTFPEEADAVTYDADLVLNETAYTEWMLRMPDRRPRYIQLTDRELAYLDGPAAEAYPRRAAYVRRLLRGDAYGYTVAATFGRARPDALGARLLRAGIVPRVEQRAERIVLLERSG